MHPPFTPDWPYEPTEESWHGGTFNGDYWRRNGDRLARHGVHSLLRGSALPEEELLHMGATRTMLADRPTQTLSAKAVAPVLGRIVLDLRYNETGQTFVDNAVCRLEAKLLGHQVIASWFS